MSQSSNLLDGEAAERERRARLGYVAPAAALVLATLYTYAFLVNADAGLPKAVAGMLHWPRGVLLRFLRNALADESGSSPRDLVDGIYLALVGIVVPWIVMAGVGRWRLSSMGVRLPNRVGVRVLIVAYVLAFPFLYWMVDGSGLPEYYLPHVERSGAFAFLTYYLVNMTGEHFLLHGVILAMLRPGLRWPVGSEVPTDDSSTHASESATRVTPIVCLLRWIGLAQRESDWAMGVSDRREGGPPGATGGLPASAEGGMAKRSAAMHEPRAPGATGGLPASANPMSLTQRGGWHAVRIWIGLPERCLFAIVGSAFLFGLVHVGKDPRELVLSLPGGVVLAWLAYRTNSFLTPYILHIATAGTALAMMVVFE